MRALVAALGRNEPWRKLAACRGISDPDLFFGKGKSLAVQNMCRGCQVREECLDVALHVSPANDYGTWAGTSPKQRVKIRAERGMVVKAPRHFAERWSTEPIPGTEEDTLDVLHAFLELVDGAA